MTGPSTTLNQMSSVMNDWSKIVDPKKLVLGISSDSIIELTAPIKEDLAINGTVPRDINVTIPSTIFDPYTNSSNDNYPRPYMEQCTFKEDHSLRVGSCFAMRLVGNSLNNNSSYTKKSNWTRKFDTSYNATYLYSLYNTTLATSSSTPLSRYYYVSYEDYQSIQYKLKLIIDNTYGGIAFSSITYDCNDLINAVTSPTSIFSVTEYPYLLPPTFNSSGPYPPHRNIISNLCNALKILIILVGVMFG